MRKETLSEQLAREAREYLADLRALRDELKTVEGLIALGLGIAAILVTVAWCIVTLGFNPPNDHIVSFVYKFGMRPCRPVNNFSGAVMFIDMILLFFLVVVSFGNVFNMMKRVREGQPREPRDLIISSSLMLVVGIGGIVFMLWVC